VDKLIEAIVNEVRVHHGIHSTLPMPRAMSLNIEARIKGYLSVTLGICNASDVVDGMADRMDLARRQDANMGLVGKWYAPENVKNL
jgi:hypothetical protein